MTDGRMARSAEENIRMFTARFDKVNAEHIARVRAHNRQWFWMQVMLTLVLTAAVVVTLLWRADS